MNTLVIDDQKSICYSLKRVLECSGHTVSLCHDGISGIEEFLRNNYDLVFLDVRLPDICGLDILTQIKGKKQNHSKVIVMTAHHDSGIAVDAIKLGAYDYILKPFDNTELQNILQNILNAANTETMYFCVDKDSADCSDKIISKSIHMINVIKKIGKLSQFDEPVLITGETGTGKDIVARAIHNYSGRSDKPFVAINCSALPRELLESELFGYEKGAFTGADKTYIGKVEYANEGTLFLDEIGDMPFDIQAKLLRVLQNKSITRLGSNKSINVNIRIISATNKKIATLLEKGLFRQDLYYRINIYEIEIPPLRKRKEDVMPLIEYFINKYTNKVVKISKEALLKLEQYNFPGNVRELENLIKRALMDYKEDTISDFNITTNNNLLNDLHHLLIQDFEISKNKISIKDYIAFLEKKLVEHYFNIYNRNQLKTAEELKIARNTLRKILEID